MPYIINKNTLAIIPFGKKTKVVELKELLTIDETSINIIENNCIINGSTLEGRQRGSSILIGSNYKPPIVVNESDNIILIPTHSSRNKDCMWLNLSGINKYQKNIKNMTTVEFSNHLKININISNNIFDRQVLRATRLESTIRNRKTQNFL